MPGRLILQARKDWQRHTSSGGFEEDITFQTPESVVAPFEVIVQGLAIKHNLKVDTDGNAVSSKNVHITVSEALLVAAGYPVRNAKNEVDLIDHKIKYADSSGNGLQEYVILQAFPDETVGIITCILGDFVVIGYDPFTDSELEAYWNSKFIIPGTENIFGDVDIDGVVTNCKDAKGNLSFDLKQSVTTQKPLLTALGIECDGINDHLISDDLPLFVKNNGDYSLFILWEVVSSDLTQVEFSFSKLSEVTNRIQHSLSLGKYFLVCQDSTGTAQLTKTGLVTGQKIQTHLNYKNNWELFINQGSAITTPSPTRKSPVGLEKIIIGNTGTLTSPTKTRFRGALLFNTLQTDVEKLAKIQTFIDNNF